MSIMNLIRSSISSLKSHKLRVFLTMIGIIIGISSVIAILSVGNGLKAEVNKSMEDVDANKISVNFEPENFDTDLALVEPFNKSDLYYIENLKGVEKAEASQGMGGLDFTVGDAAYFNKTTFIVLDDYTKAQTNVKYGRSFEKNDNSKKMILLDYKVAEELFDSPKKSIGNGITINRDIYEVIGVLEKVGTFSLTGGTSYVPKSIIENLNEDVSIFAVDVYVKPEEDKDEVFESIKSELIKSHPNLEGEYTLQDPQEVTKVFENIIGGLTAFIALVSGISLFVGGIGVMNIMYVSVSERKREIGIRRAIGAKPKSILTQFLLESIIVTGIGGLLGIFTGYILSKIISAFLPFPPVMSTTSIIGATLISVLIGIIFGIIPAINASKMDPIKAIYK